MNSIYSEIAMSGSDVYQNTANIQQNTALILQNTADILQNTADIQQNTNVILENILIKCKITISAGGVYEINNNTGFIPYPDTGSYFVKTADGIITMLIPLTASLVYCTGSGSSDATGGAGTYMVACCWKQATYVHNLLPYATELSISTMKVDNLNLPVDITDAGQIVLIVSKN